MTVPRAELGQFLRARRDRLTPAAAGMAAFPGARRVPGLRREELAVLAGLSPEYYSRVEQGRQATVSDEVLFGLARALQLSAAEAAHLRDLAAPPRPGNRRPATERAERADPGLLRMLTALDHLPALVMGRRSTVLARTALIPGLLGRSLDPGSRFGEYLLTDPLARQRILNWSDFAEAAVAAMRRETSAHPDDQRLRDWIVALRRDPDVDRWWNDYQVREHTSMRKRIDHPEFGELIFDVEQLTAPTRPDQFLVVYTVQPDSPTARLLPLLGSWSAEPARS